MCMYVYYTIPLLVYYFIHDFFLLAFSYLSSSICVCVILERHGEKQHIRIWQKYRTMCEWFILYGCVVLTSLRVRKGKKIITRYVCVCVCIKYTQLEKLFSPGCVCDRENSICSKGHRKNINVLEDDEKKKKHYWKTMYPLAGVWYLAWWSECSYMSLYVFFHIWHLILL